jgi:hypothetical protein
LEEEMGAESAGEEAGAESADEESAVEAELTTGSERG